MVSEIIVKVFELIFEQCGIGLVYVSLEGGFICVNVVFSNFFGYSKDELVKLDFQDIIYFDYFDKDFQYVVEVLDGFYDIYQMEKFYIYKNGKMVWGNLIVILV